MITVLLPTKDNEVELALALASLVAAAVEGVVRQVIVVDHGSRDGSTLIAESAGCEVVEATETDALARAASGAKSDWLLFLSPSAVLDPGWSNEALGFIDGAMMTGNARHSAATFRFARAEGGLGARLEERTAAFRSGLLAAPYPEQGLLLSKDFYRALGGHRPLPAMGDVDLARRVGRRHLTVLRSRATVDRRLGGPAGRRGRVRSAAALAMFVLRLPTSVIARVAN